MRCQSVPPNRTASTNRNRLLTESISERSSPLRTIARGCGVWLPLPPSDEVQEIRERQFSTFPDSVEPVIATEPVYGNQFACFEFDHPQGAQIIRHSFTATCWNLNWHLSDAAVVHVTEWPDSFDPYLRPQTLRHADEFTTVMNEIIPKRSGPAADLQAVFGWIDRNLTYDHIDASLQADANHAFERRRGHCSDYHGLCATMGRSLGYPTRVTYGLSLFPKNSPSHCKVEAFLPPYGWVSFDVSETQKLLRSIERNSDLSATEKLRLTEAARQRLHRGFRENSWLLMTRGTDYELAPRASAPVRVVRTIYAEADGQPLPEPDPANSEQREFGWMTAHSYTADRSFQYPFQDLTTLQAAADSPQ